jgi:hypothetical protein
MQKFSNKNIFLENGGVPEAPIFFQPWWLDIVCQKGIWEVCLVQNKEGKTLGLMPYYLETFFGAKIIRTPPFTPYLGVWLDYSTCSDRLHNRYGFENQVIGELIDQLPKVISYHQVHPEQLQNWLPFYWRGYRQTTRYTYILDMMDTLQIQEGMKDKTRNLIRKAEKFGLSINQEKDLGKFTFVHQKTFSRQLIKYPHNLEIFGSLHEEIQRREQGAIYFAEDNKGLAHAALYLIWDHETAYCWQLGVDTELSKSGAVQLLIWHTIQEAIKMGKRYNLEGSMLPHIEPVFRAFGAERRPVFQIRKFGNRLIEAAWVLLYK